MKDAVYRFTVSREWCLQISPMVVYIELFEHLVLPYCLGNIFIFEWVCNLAPDFGKMYLP